MTLPRAPGLGEGSDLSRAEMQHGGQVLPQTEQLFLLRKWGLAGGHPSPGRSLQQPSCGRMASRRPVAGLGWRPRPQMCFLKLCPPLSRARVATWDSGRPVGVQLRKVSGGSERAEMEEEGRWWAGAGPLCVGSGGCRTGRNLRPACPLDPDLRPLGACWLGHRGRAHWGPTGGIPVLTLTRG